MLKRKIEDVLLTWKQEENHKPIVIKGCRQCGKTFSVMKFAHEKYQHVVYLNFMLNSDYALAFEGSKVVDDMVINISAMIPGSVFLPKQTCLILDEIQECPAARTALKYFLMFFFLLLFFLLSQIYCPNCGSRFGHSLPAS